MARINKARVKLEKLEVEFMLDYARSLMERGELMLSEVIFIEFIAMKMEKFLVPQKRSFTLKGSEGMSFNIVLGRINTSDPTTEVIAKGLRDKIIKAFHEQKTPKQ